ncbi:MAG: hypothetical protein WC789_07155 [Lentisphaeria bacterium]|jgi:hypothetical protein
MRIKHKVNPRISDDSAGKNMLFGLDDALAEVTIDVHTKQANHLFSVLAAVTESLSLGDVGSPAGLYMEVSAPCTVTLDAGTPEEASIRMVVPTGGTKAKLFLEATFATVEITTAVSTPVTGKICVWGS